MNAGRERQQAALILQQNDTFLRDLLSNAVPAFDIGNLPDDRMIEQAGCEDTAKNAVHVVIEFVFGDFAARYGFSERVAKEEFVGLFHIKAGMGSFDGGVRAAPIGKNKSLESEVLLQHVGEEITVLAGKLSIHAIVGTHDAASIRDAKSDLEGAQIGFSHGPLADVCVERIAPTLLIVEGVMFQITNDVFGLDAANDVPRHRASQQRVFTFVFESASAPWLASQVYASTLRHAVSLIAEFAADERSILEGCLRIPRRSRRKIAG